MIRKLGAGGLQYLPEHNAYVIKSYFKLVGSNEEYSVPTVWTLNDMRQPSPEQLANLMGSLLENTLNSLGDLAEMKAAELEHRPWPATEEEELHEVWPEDPQ